MVYLFPILLTLLLIYHYDYRGHKEGRIIWYIFLLVYCISVAGLRYRIGGDTVVYMLNHYDRLPDLSGYWSYDFTNEKFGRGYVFLNAIARSISDNFVVMQIILAVILNSVVFRFFYKNTPHIFTAVLFYMLLAYLNLNTEVLRESMAIACLLLGWEFFYRHKWWQYYLICAVAFFFHPSSAFMMILPVFTLKFFHKAFSFSWLSVGLAFGLYFLGIVLTSKFFDLIRLIGIATMDSYADMYEGSGITDAKNFNIVGNLLDILSLIVYPLIVCWIISKRRGNGEDNGNEEEGYKGGLVLMILTYAYVGAMSSSMIILYRFNNYLVLFFILGAADALFSAIRLFKHRVKFSYTLWMVFIFPVLYVPVNRLYRPSGRSQTAFIHRYYPYYSVINPELDSEREKINYFYQQTR